MISQQRLVAFAALAALTIPFGIAVHLTAEFAGLGYRDDAVLIFSSRHFYLAVLALLSLSVFFTAFRSIAPSDRRRILTQLASELPFAGRGAGFAAFSFIAQLGFFFVTQFAEGCPLGAGDLGSGILAAVIASAVGAIAVSLCKTHLIRVIVEIVFLISAQSADRKASAARRRIDAHIRVWHCRALIKLSANLPPPQLLTR